MSCSRRRHRALQCEIQRRGTYKLFDVAMHAQLQHSQQMKIAMRDALARGEFELHYQPLVSLESRCVSCCEALLRCDTLNGE